jgi:uncharacterized damage-inducible protein DinB
MNEFISSQKLLDALEVRVENHLKYTIEVFQNLDNHHLIKKSKLGGWNIAECIWHLNSYGHFYLPEIEKALRKNTRSSNLFKSGLLGRYFTKVMKPGPKMKKMKAFKNHTPPTISNPRNEVALFIKQQEQLLKLISAARKSDLTNVKIPISIARFIKLRLGDVFQFIIEHNERHLAQAKNNLK